jgi:type I restriction enzyme S subunit
MKKATVLQAAVEEQDHDTDLPEGWATATLGQIAERIQYGYTASAIQANGPRFLRITDIQNGKVDWESVPSCEISEADAEKYSLKAGDIVFARTGATTGKSFLIGSCPQAVFASYLIRVRGHKLLNPAFLIQAFNTPQYWAFIMDNVAGNAQPNCNASKLAALTVPVAPAAEQDRLIATFNQVAAKIDASRVRLAKVPKILKAFRQSVMAAACSGRLTEDWRENTSAPAEDGKALFERISATRNRLVRTKSRENELLPSVTSDEQTWELPPSWCYVRLGDISQQIADIDHKMPKAVERGVKFISAKDLLDDGTLNLTRDIKLISEVDYERLSRKAKPQRNDIIYSRIGARLGKARLVETDERFLVSYSCCVIRPLIVLPQYVARFLDSGVVLAQAQKQAKSIGVPDLGLDEIKHFAVPLPSLEEQHEIVRRVEALFKLADAIETRVEAAAKRADKLTQAILVKAFRGELVPTEAELARREGRTYEPASELLARICAGCDKSAAT